MPLPRPPRPLPGPSSRLRQGPHRRSLLAGALGTAVAVVLTGCSDEGAAAHAESGSAARRLREEGARQSRELLARYDATAEAHPALADRLRPLRAEVAAHAAALSQAASASPSASSSSGAASEARGRAASAPTVPGDEAGALAALADAERRTADARATALLTAPPELARLLASVAAAGAGHAYLLTEGG